MAAWTPFQRLDSILLGAHFSILQVSEDIYGDPTGSPWAPPYLAALELLSFLMSQALKTV